MNDFWNIEGNTLRIDGEITSDGWDWGTKSVKKGSNTRLREALQNMQGDVVVWINSPGGSVIVGSEIYTMLRSYNGRVRVVIDGIAASAASVIAMAGDEVVMSPTAYMMIHCASTVAYGNRQAMEQGAEMLMEVDKGIISAYQLKTGRSAEELQAMMERETWMNATRARELGFCDRILFEDENSEETSTPLMEAYNLGRTRTDVAAIWLSREGERQNTLQDCVACAARLPSERNDAIEERIPLLGWQQYRESLTGGPCAAATVASTPHHPGTDFFGTKLNIATSLENTHHEAQAHELRLKLLASFAAGDWIGGVDWAANTHN